MRLDHDTIRRTLLALVDDGMALGDPAMHRLFGELKYLDDKGDATVHAHVVADLLRDDSSWNLIENARLMATVKGLPWGMRLEFVQDVTKQRIAHAIPQALDAQAQRMVTLPIVDQRNNGFRARG